MSVIHLPRRPEALTPRPATRPAPRTPARPVSSRRASGAHVRRNVALRRSVVIVAVALVIALAGTMLEANRQIELHSLQTQLLQNQSSYAEQVGSLSNLSAPGQVATQAGDLHLVSPTVVIQVPSTSLDKPLPLPKFLGYAPATSRTNR